ncbi:hypothetical protein [Nonomuraea diastatica]|uniref:Uncharacterized protein n=1 Tax=Nonomuraea diastatica TaxID=1848329 RepID=A0A4R4WS90_9ACTN|nr:hypothetical protein [Nonomuraea diastatica]TDD20433.1 hypothetical protein E1294_17615 [Nonomuraea diastatica]
MTESLEIAREAVREAASRMVILGEDFDAALQGLTESGAIGDDGLLAGFLSALAESLTEASEMRAALSHVMAATGDGLRLVASSTEAAEAASGEHLELRGESWA